MNIRVGERSNYSPTAQFSFQINLFKELYHRTYIYITMYQIFLPPWKILNSPTLDDIYINQIILYTVNIQNTFLTTKIYGIKLGIASKKI